jgi:hypothetical protein
MSVKAIAQVCAGVTLALSVAVLPVQAAVITYYENPHVRADVASYIVFDDGQDPVIVGDSQDVGDQFDSNNAPPASWSESVQAHAEAHAGDLFHSTTASASMTRTWVTPALLTIRAEAFAGWEDNVPELAPGPRGYSTGSVGTRSFISFLITTPTQITIDYVLGCCYSEFTLTGDIFDSNYVLINAFALQTEPPDPTTGTFSQLLQPNYYLLLAETGAGISSDYSTNTGSFSSFFDLRVVFDEPSAVLEPGTAGLLTIGLLGLLIQRRIFGPVMRASLACRGEPAASSQGG